MLGEEDEFDVQIKELKSKMKDVIIKRVRHVITRAVEELDEELRVFHCFDNISIELKPKKRRDKEPVLRWLSPKEWSRIYRDREERSKHAKC